MRAVVLVIAGFIAGCDTAGLRPPDVRYEPTPVEVAQAMLELAALRPGDVVADLGCGDGRLVVEALRRGAARGLCVDINPEVLAMARENARAAGVAERIQFLNQDLFGLDYRGTTVVLLYLSPQLNRALRPKLQRELAPGARVVSHWHDMGDWPPARSVRLRPSGGRERPVYLWVIDGNR